MRRTHANTGIAAQMSEPHDAGHDAGTGHENCVATFDRSRAFRPWLHDLVAREFFPGT